MTRPSQHDLLLLLKCLVVALGAITLGKGVLMAVDADNAVLVCIIGAALVLVPLVGTQIVEFIIELPGGGKFVVEAETR